MGWLAIGLAVAGFVILNSLLPKQTTMDLPASSPAPSSCDGDLMAGLKHAHVTSSYTAGQRVEHGTHIDFACDGDCSGPCKQVGGHTTRVCFDGKWTGDPLQCKNVDECELRIDRCYSKKYCHNNDKGYTCSCPDKWTLDTTDKHTCKAPGCGKLEGIEHGIVIGAPRRKADHKMRVFFHCDYGYKLHGSSASTCLEGVWEKENGEPQCLDIDECASDHGCSQVCVNIDGSYKCDCNDGYSLDGTGKDCNPACTGLSSCLHGECVAPQTCKCDEGWSGHACDKAICDPPCVHGLCVYPKVCLCTRGWTGPTCSDDMCWGGCLNGGTCTGPLQCSCLEEFAGDRCEILSCEDLPPPDNGLIDCLTFNKQRVCTLYCKDGYGFPGTIDNPYVCGQTGLWSNELNRESVPDCSPVDPIAIIVAVETDYEFEGECAQLTAEAMQQIRERSLEIIRGRICPDGCTEVEISAPDDPVCGEVIDNSDPFGQVKRQAAVRSKISLKYIIEAVKLGNATTAKYCTGACRTAVYAAARNVHTAAQKAKTDLKRDPVVLTVENLTFSVVKDSVKASRPMSRCKSDEVKIGTRCMKCPKGTYIKDYKCLLCPIGTYQDETSQSSCKDCPSDTTTFAAGSKSKSDCVTNCTRGLYSRTGMGPCNKCPLNTFQDMEGQTSCKSCPNGTFTASPGTYDQDHCLSQSNCSREQCGRGFLCDNCTCINDQKVCDLVADCEDESDELNCVNDEGIDCADLVPCRSNLMQDRLLCMSDVILWVKIKGIENAESKSGNRQIVTVDNLNLYVVRQRVPPEYLNVTESKFYLGTKASFCRCPTLEVGKQYILTLNWNTAIEPVVSHDSLAIEWSYKTKKQLHDTMSRLNNERCEILLNDLNEAPVKVRADQSNVSV